MKFVENNLNWIHSANHPSCDKVRYAELAFKILREGNSVRFSTKSPELLGNEEFRILQPKTRVFLLEERVVKLNQFFIMKIRLPQR